MMSMAVLRQGIPAVESGIHWRFPGRREASGYSGRCLQTFGDRRGSAGSGTLAFDTSSQFRIVPHRTRINLAGEISLFQGNRCRHKAPARTHRAGVRPPENQDKTAERTRAMFSAGAAAQCLFPERGSPVTKQPFRGITASSSPIGCSNCRPISRAPRGGTHPAVSRAAATLR